MSAPKFDSLFIEQELRNSRRVVEKSMELSKKFVLSESLPQDRIAELTEKLRNEEYLKNSYEKALKDNLLILKEEQKKNLDLEKKLACLRAEIDAKDEIRISKLASRLEKVEKALREDDRNSEELTTKKHKSRFSSSLFTKANEAKAELNEDDRIHKLDKRLKRLEKTLKTQTLSHAKSTKALPTKLKTPGKKSDRVKKITSS